MVVVTSNVMDQIPMLRHTSHETQRNTIMRGTQHHWYLRSIPMIDWLSCSFVSRHSNNVRLLEMNTTGVTALWQLVVCLSMNGITRDTFTFTKRSREIDVSSWGFIHTAIVPMVHITANSITDDRSSVDWIYRRTENNMTSDRCGRAHVGMCHIMWGAFDEEMIIPKQKAGSTCWFL